MSGTADSGSSEGLSERIARLLKLSKSDFTKAVAGESDEVISAVTTEILKHAAHENEPLDTWVDILSWLVCGGVPELVMKKVREDAAKDTRKNCGKLWRENEPAYRCTTCGVSPSSAICGPCFHAGNHEGHDYHLFYSVYGGMCDCGDEGSWRKEGFCCDHQGPPKELSPELFLEGDLVRRAELVLRVVVHALMTTIGEGNNAGVGLLAWLRTFISNSTGFQLVLAKVLMEVPEAGTPAKQGHTCLDFLVLESTALVKSMEENLSTIFLSLLFDMTFKVQFMRVYIRHYPSFFDFNNLRACGRVVDEQVLVSMIDRVSSQLFNVPALTLRMIKEEELLEQLIGTARKLLCGASQWSTLKGASQWISSPEPEHDYSTLTVDCDSELITKRIYWPLFMGMQSAIGHHPVAAYFVRAQTDLVSEWLKVVVLLQGMNVQEREVDQHVEYEKETWVHAFSIELEMLQQIHPIIQSVYTENIDDHPVGLLNPDEAMLSMVARCFQLLRNWFVSGGVHVFSESPHNPSLRHKVLFHIPLHRVLSSLIHRLIEEGHTAVGALNGEYKSVEDGIVMVSHILWLHAILAQMKAGMWKRNGTSLIRQSAIYQSNVCTDECFDSDVFLLQYGCVLMGADAFVHLMQVRFGLEEWFRLGAEDSHVEDGDGEMLLSSPTCVALAEGLVRLLIVLYVDRSRLGASEDQQIRREIIHCLARRDCSHSKLTEAISNQLVRSAKYEEILATVATYTQPTELKEGYFSLKPECWDEFDPYFFHYSARDLQLAMENRKSIIPREKFPVGPQPCETMAEVSGIWGIPRSPNVQQLVLTIIYRSAMELPGSSDQLLQHALFLLIFLLRDSDILPSVGVNSDIIESEWEDTQLPRGSFTRKDSWDIIVGLLLRLKQKDLSQDLSNIVYRTLGMISLRDKKCKEKIESETSLLSAQTAGPSTQSNMEAAKSRQAQILANFASRQQDFGIDMYDSDEEDVVVCSLCRESSKDQDRPMGLVCLRDKSTALTFHNRLHLDEIGKNSQSSPPYPFSLGFAHPFSADSMPSNTDTASSPSQARTPVELAANTVDAGKPESEAPKRNHRHEETEVEYYWGRVEHTTKEQEAKTLVCGMPEQVAKIVDFSANMKHSGVYIQNCGHVLHYDCFSRYLASLKHSDERSEDYEGRGIVELHAGEFLCPFCRRLANGLIPYYSSEDIRHTDSMAHAVPSSRQSSVHSVDTTCDGVPSKDDLLQELKTGVWGKSAYQSHLTAHDMSKDQDTVENLLEDKKFAQLFEVADDFVKKVTASQLLCTAFNTAPPPNIVAVWRSICLMIMTIEGASRAVPGKTSSVSVLKDEQIMLARALLKIPRIHQMGHTFVYRREASKVLQSLWQNVVLRRTVNDIDTSAMRSPEQKPGLECMNRLPFAVLMEIMALWPFGVPITPNDVVHMMVYVWSMTVIQAVAAAEAEYHIDVGTTPRGDSGRELVTLMYEHVKSSQPLLEIVRMMCLPTIRCMYLFSKVYLTEVEWESREASIPLGDIIGADPFDHMLAHLRLPSIGDILEPSVWNVLMVDDLADAISRRYFVMPAVVIPKPAMEYPRPPPPLILNRRPNGLIRLPHMYQDLFQHFRSARCMQCLSVPQQPAVCLSCGVLVCAGTACCSSANKGECSIHAKKCGNGVGMYIMVRSSTILILNGKRCCMWGSPYLDSHGEEDIHLRRGRPLYLNEGRMAILTRIWALRSFDLESSFLHRSRLLLNASY